jgi:hypothetical protein
MPKTDETKPIIKKYMDEMQLTYRSMADTLNEVVQPHFSVSHNAVNLWINGYSCPAYHIAREVYNKTEFCDWRKNFALEIMQVLRPDIWDWSKG